MKIDRSCIKRISKDSEVRNNKGGAFSIYKNKISMAQIWDQDLKLIQVNKGFLFLEVGKWREIKDAHYSFMGLPSK